MTNQSYEGTRYLSPWTDSIIEILGVHLHRYMMPLLMDHKINHLGVLVGFEASHMPAVALRVTSYGTEVIDLHADYDKLVSQARDRDDLSAVMEVEIDGKNLVLFPVLSISEPGREHIHAFVIAEDAKIFDADILTVALRTRINEAIRAFRNNSLRIVFDECEGASPKDFLARVLDLLPVWCGVDHSASLILASSLESMVLSGVGPASFQIVAEKLYCAPAEENKAYDNMSTLEFVVRHGENSGLIGHAFDEVRRTRTVGLNIFIGDPDTDEWFSMGEIQKSAHRVATKAYRPIEKLTVMLPLLCTNEVGQQELLGFLSICFFETMPLASLTSRVLETLATRLGTYLHRSSFFSLSAQQLWLLECVREEQVSVSRLLKNAGDTSAEIALPTFIQNVNNLVAQETQIPCFAIGYRVSTPNGDILRFSSPHGFTIFNDIDLSIYPDEPINSSLAALSARLNRVITLTGGTDHDGCTKFENNIFVNEALGTLCDGRLCENLDDSWRKLSDYYKPSREGNYATLCYPIRMKDEVVGVIAVEVNRDTNWVWWTGFGSYLFYRLLANELAADFSLLGLDVPEN